MLTILSQSERKRIADAGREIFAEVGVRLRYKPVYDRLVGAGAVPVAGDPDALTIPGAMTDKYMALCPKSFTIKDRKNNAASVESGGEPLFYTSNAVTYLRGASKTVTEIGADELADFIRVADALPHIHGAVGTGVVDFPPFARDFAGFFIMAQNTYKHLRPCIYTPSGVEAIIEMAHVITDGAPLSENMFFTLGYSIVSPLTWSETALNLFDKSKGHKIPMMINSEPMAGGTSPVTLAGSLALSDAEIISGIVINQVIEPGRPCVYNAGFAHVLDMMTTIVLTGAPENALLQSAGAEMAAYHGLPCASWALSDSLMLDSQSAYEKYQTLLAHTLSGVNMIWGIGNTETSKTISPEAAVIDNEIIGNCLRFKKGIEVDGDRLALELIKEVGFSGKFLETEHTFEYYRDELRTSNLPNRVNRIIWEQKGSKSIEEKAEATVDAILNKKPENYLSGPQIERLTKIRNRWIEGLGK